MASTPNFYGNVLPHSRLRLPGQVNRVFETPPLPPPPDTSIFIEENSVATVRRLRGDLSEGTQLYFSHEVLGGNNRVLLIGLSGGDMSEPTSVLWNGTPLTLLGYKQEAAASSYLYYLIAPEVGYFDIELNLVGEVFGLAGAISFKNVDQDVPFGDVITGWCAYQDPASDITIPASTTQSLAFVMGTHNGQFTETPGHGMYRVWYDSHAGNAWEWTGTLVYKTGAFTDALFSWDIDGDFDQSNFTMVGSYLNPANIITFNDPSSIETGMAWYKADSISMGDNTEISEWIDSMFIGGNATQNGTARPVVINNEINGLPVVRFDNVEDGMVTPLFIDWNTSWTMFLVYKMPTLISGGHRVIQGSDNFLIGPYDLYHKMFHDGFIDGPPVVENEPVYVTAVAKRDIGRTLRVNGEKVGSNNSIGGIGTVYFGGAGAFGEMAACDVAETIFYYRNLCPIEIGLIEDYLYTKYWVPSAPSFVASDYGDVGLWVAGSFTTDCADNEIAGSIQDYSGYSRMCYSGMGGQQPVFKANSVNGKSSYWFDAINDGMVTNVFLDNDTPFSIFIVYKTDSPTSERNAISGDARDFRIGTDPDGKPGVYNGGWIAGAPLATPNFILSTLINKPSVAACSWRVNGGDCGSTGRTIGPGNINLAAHGFGTSRPLDGNIAEILVYLEAIEPTNRDIIENYLINKYDL